MQLTMIKDRRLGPDMPFLDSDTCAEEGGEVYLFLAGFSSLYDAIHGWMTGRMDEKSFTTRHPLLYIIIGFLLWFQHIIRTELVISN
jgi:hypothetical protein